VRVHEWSLVDDRRVDLYTEARRWVLALWVPAMQPTEPPANLTVYEIGSERRGGDIFALPEKLMAAYRAGEPVMPILDWVLETHRPAWLEACLAELGPYTGEVS
jgi:hypothetical protein